MKAKEETKPIQIHLPLAYVDKLTRLQERHLGVAASRVCSTFVMKALDAEDEN